MAAVAVTTRKVFVIGDRKMVIADVTLTGSYLAGGETLTAAMLGLEIELNDVDCPGAVGSAGRLDAQYNHTTSKLQLFGAVDASPAANEAGPELGAVALPGGPLTCRIRAIGKGAVATAP